MIKYKIDPYMKAISSLHSPFKVSDYVHVTYTDSLALSWQQNVAKFTIYWLVFVFYALV